MNETQTNGALKHPSGLKTLFFTEMWERFSYYGMRALLVLFMTDQVRGGMGLTDKTATAIYGLYTASVYLMSLPGGWLADRVMGAQRTVWFGGIIIASGHFTLALPWTQTFFLGLILVVVGSGMLKTNMSTMVAELYPEGGARRDAGYTIFYMGVNVGATFGPLVCGWLAEKIGWHWGFAAAGVGMVLGLTQFRIWRGLLGNAGTKRGDESPLHVIEKIVLAIGVITVLAVLGLGLSGAVKINPVWMAEKAAYGLAIIGALFFIYALVFCNLSVVEKKRVVMILILFIASALFWAGYEQTGSTFNLFAERHTLRQFDWFPTGDHLIPASWFQSLNPVFVITFAPVFAWLWVWLARRNLDPSIPLKFGLSLVLLAAGFLVMVGAAKVVAGGQQALPTWLIMTYLVHTFGELCMSPVGLSAVSKLAPRQLAGQMMGIWFLSISMGNLLAGLLAGHFNWDEVQSWPGLYLKITIFLAVVGLLLVILSRPLKRLMTGIK
jgi:proton-dependent oligopeptide transporter, POT family